MIENGQTQWQNPALLKIWFIRASNQNFNHHFLILPFLPAWSIASTSLYPTHFFFGGGGCGKEACGEKNKEVSSNLGIAVKQHFAH